MLELAPAPRRFGFGDFAMAATIFLASLLALAPAVLRGKERWGRAACLNNLQKVGVRLHQYAALNHAYPFVDSEEQVPHAGAILCRLKEAGLPDRPPRPAVPVQRVRARRSTGSPSTPRLPSG